MTSFASVLDQVLVPRIRPSSAIVPDLVQFLVRVPGHPALLAIVANLPGDSSDGSLRIGTLNSSVRMPFKTMVDGDHTIPNRLPRDPASSTVSLCGRPGSQPDTLCEPLPNPLADFIGTVAAERPRTVKVALKRHMGMEKAKDVGSFTRIGDITFVLKESSCCSLLGRSINFLGSPGSLSPNADIGKQPTRMAWNKAVSLQWPAYRPHHRLPRTWEEGSSRIPSPEGLGTAMGRQFSCWPQHPACHSHHLGMSTVLAQISTWIADLDRVGSPLVTRSTRARYAGG